MKNLFIDSNIWLSLYHFSNDDLNQFITLKKRIGNEIRPSTSKMILYFPYDPNKDTQENECFKSLWSDEYISFIKEAMGIAMDIESLRNRILQERI